MAIYALKEGGTEEKKIEVERRNMQTLTDKQVLQLERMGRTIEAYFGRPQDIEWCLYENRFFIVQSRPITTLYPLPHVQDGKNHVYMSFSHQQIMTDAMKPLGLSFFQLLSGGISVIQIGGRLYFDLAHDLAYPMGQKIALLAMSKIDPLMYNAIKRLMKRKAFMKSLARGKRFIRMGTGYFSWALPIQAIKIYRRNDAAIVQNLMSRNEASVRNLQQRIANQSGDELFAFITEAHKQLKKAMYNPQSMAVVYVGVYAVNWINKKMEKWLGEKSAADSLSQSVVNYVTSEMGLALLDVADVIRQYPAVVNTPAMRLFLKA